MHITAFTRVKLKSPVTDDDVLVILPLSLAEPAPLTFSPQTQVPLHWAGRGDEDW